MGQGPFNVTSGTSVEGASFDLEASHGHSGTDFSEFNVSIAGLDKDMMPDFDTVLDILESNDTSSDSVRTITGREDVLEDLNDPLPQTSCEALENEMWVRLGDCSPGRVRYISSQDDVVEGKGSSRAMGKMRDSHGGRSASMFV